MPDELVSTKGIADLVKVTRKHVTDVLSKDPTFPIPKIDESQKARLWSKYEVLTWFAERAKRKRISHRSRARCVTY